MTYHALLFLRLVPSALALAFVVYIALRAAEMMNAVVATLQQGVTP